MERRRFKRLRTRVPLIGKAVRSGPSFEGHVMNMSVGGFSFETRAEIPLRKSFEFEICTPEGFDGPNLQIRISGEVRWCTPSQEEEGAYWIGVMFQPGDDGQKRTIETFVADHTVEEARRAETSAEAE